MNKIKLSFILLSGILMSACGQKGDLYLPNIAPAPNILDRINSGPMMPQPESDESKEVSSDSQVEDDPSGKQEKTADH